MFGFEKMSLSTLLQRQIPTPHLRCCSDSSRFFLLDKVYAKADRRNLRLRRRERTPLSSVGGDDGKVVVDDSRNDLHL